MQLKYKFFRGGTKNPFEDEVRVSYDKITEEREITDPERKMSISTIFPRLDSWPDYVLALSKSTFWQMEKAICESKEGKDEEVERLWEEAEQERLVGEWLKEVEADESEKALCYFMASQYRQFNPDDNIVDFRLYFSEGGKPIASNNIVGDSTVTYEE